MNPRSRIARIIWPLGAFLLTAAFHFIWLGLFPEQEPAQSRWAALPVERSWLKTYLETQAYWMGYAYALTAALAAEAVRRFMAARTGTARNMAIGGVTASTLLAAVGCFLIGCCGSPMLIVWMNLFGARFLPLARPAVAALTTLSVAAAWWWMHRKIPAASPDSCCCPAQPSPAE